MLSVLIRSTSVLAVIATTMMAQPAFAAEPVAAAAAKKRCNDLVAFYDRWGATRTPDNSDGARNHRRINAAFDCERGNYEKGIAKMEALLHDKGFDVPVDVGEGPMYFPDQNRGPAQALKPR
ncbi:MAG: hypothetical protein J0J01_26560 [Reyranella sp.]|uniref:hypothetical protein n=1 Tax=Reyranella sp. TaxID=1929291 RepID=UPI001AC9E94F|nr:hypothetical protein [Reyranella sp.]MBN9090490.1 hypothetical protein [Reyranella sp.]